MSAADRSALPYERTIRAGGTVAAAFAVVALLGWGFDKPLLSRFGADLMPMAPITAVWLIVHGATMVLRARSPRAPWLLWGSGAVHGAGAILAAALLFTSSSGTLFSIERLGFESDETVAGMPIGHISPAAAFGFLLASVATLAVTVSSLRNGAATMVTLWTAWIIFTFFFAVLLAYVFGAPLLYGGAFVPPAVNTSLAFQALGAALIADAARLGRRRRDDRAEATGPSPVVFGVVVFAVLATIVTTAGYLYFRSQQRHYRTEVARTLTSVVEMKTSEVTQYRRERLGDGLVFYRNSAFSDLVRHLLFDGAESNARAQIRDWLDKVREHYQYSRLALLDKHAVELIVVPESEPPLASSLFARVAEVVDSGVMTLEDLHYNEHDGRRYLELLVPVLGEADERLGILAIRVDPEAHLYPMLRRWPNRISTAETQLVRRDGTHAVVLSDTAIQPGGLFSLRFPLTATYIPAVAAALGRDGIVDGVDARGVQVIAAVRTVPDSPWALAASISVAEAYAPLATPMWMTIALVISLLSTAGIAVGFTWRQQRARFYRAKYEAERERARLRDLLARSLNEIYVFEPETLRFTFVNDGACRNIGYSAEELARMTPLDIKPKFTEESFRAQLEPLRKGKQELLVFETVHRRKDGSEYPVEVHLQYLPAENHPVYLAVMNDISERQQAEAQLRQAQKMEAVGRLAGGVAHDFNNQIFVVNGYCDLLLDECAGNSEMEVPLAEIKKAAQRAAGLTAQLLAFSRKQVLQPRVLDLNAELAAIESMLQRLIGENIDLSFTPGSELWNVKVDPNQLQQVVLNLVVNAGDAMPTGGKLTIATRNVELDEGYIHSAPELSAGPYVLLSISDTGHGMMRDTLAHLFDPFFTTKEKGKGTGLGLATAYGIVKQSGGHIAAYSEPGQGATFKIYLPRVYEQVDANHAPVSMATPAQVGGTETILLAEDEPAVRDLLHRVLTEHGYQVLTAANGREAVAVASDCKHPIHLLLTDVVMPEMSGAQVAERMRSLHPESRVLYMSGYTEDSIVSHGVLAEGLAFLPKPCPTDELLRRVRGILDGARPADLQGRRVLLVDDSEDERLLQARVLTKAGCEVLHARNGNEAMEVLERESVDAVLTDVNMPSMDGFALTEAIRRTPRLQQLPVIVLSGAGANEDAARSSTAGANACLNKGTTNPDEILDLLARTWSE